MMRRGTVLAVMAVVSAVAACSGSDPDVASRQTDAPATSVVAPANSDATATTDPGAADGAQLGAEWTVAVGVEGRTADGGFGADAEWTFDPGATNGEGAFGQFASCSGLQEHVGAYSVSLSAVGTFEVVTVSTSEPVTTAGIYDAQIQLRRRDGDLSITGGSLTVFDGLQTGEFVSAEGDDLVIEGTFECAGAPPPAPLEVGDVDDGELEAVEVFALLRSGGEQRIVGLAGGLSASADCPAASGGEAGATILRISGDARLGSITDFEVGNDPMVVRMSVNGVDYDFADATVSIVEDGAAGTFTASAADGVSVDGAFRCR